MTGPPLTAREDAVLAAVERRLTNAEIAAEFSISVRTVESHIAALRRKLGVDSRAEMIGAARSRRRPAVQVPRNSFVGRDADLAAVRARLAAHRWVTVVGPAGGGKTRLALELAAAAERVPFVVELELAGPADVPAAVAAAVGVGAGTDDVLAACGVALGGRPALLVLDNADRVAGPVRDVVGRLLAAAGDLAVLVTCRSPVGGSDEAVHALAPLPVGGPAERLFADRAGPAADPELVARVCRRLDGLPLAIELAAARARHLPLTELADRLDAGFGPLDRAGAPSRHRTLEAAFDWTWDLLDAAERTVLGRLAALPGTVDLALADAVAGTDAGGTVLRLLDRSLLAPAGPPGRFRLLAALRDFVLARTDPAVTAPVRAAHAAFVAERVAALAAAARTDDSPAAAERAALLLPEATAALDWALGPAPELALPLARAAAVLAEQYGPRPDTLAALTRAARDPRLRAAATPADLLPIGQALCYSDVELVAELGELALARAATPAEVADARHLAANAAAYRGRISEALAHLDAAGAGATGWGLGSVGQIRGIALREADPPAALAAYGAALDAYASAGDAMHVNNVRYMMALTAAGAGLRTMEAAAWAEQCVAYARETGNRHELAHALLTRATLRPDADGADLDPAIEVFRLVGDLRCLTRGYLAAARRRPAGQVALLRLALDVAERARDAGHRVTALEQLVAALWAAGDRRGAAIALGRLSVLVEDAAGRAPAGLRAELDQWAPAQAEGRARG